MITQDRLKEVLDYDRHIGVFTWKINTGCKHLAGKIAGSRDKKDDYIQIRIDKKLYRGHRLAWLYVYGSCPKYIDHINMDRGDNRIDNLRPATQSEQMANTRSKRKGLKGCCWDKSKNYWKAEITHLYKRIWIGSFNTEQEAHNAYMIKAKQIFGDFARAA